MHFFITILGFFIPIPQPEIWENYYSKPYLYNRNDSYILDKITQIVHTIPQGFVHSLFFSQFVLITKYINKYWNWYTANTNNEDNGISFAKKRENL